jgi:hypothetical protein
VSLKELGDACSGFSVGSWEAPSSASNRVTSFKLSISLRTRANSICFRSKTLYGSSIIALLRKVVALRWFCEAYTLISFSSIEGALVSKNRQSPGQTRFWQQKVCENQRTVLARKRDVLYF